ncbi:hypothetical protein ACLOJK_034256 [Asimina triloba]
MRVIEVDLSQCQRDVVEVGFEFGFGMRRFWVEECQERSKSRELSRDQDPVRTHVQDPEDHSVNKWIRVQKIRSPDHVDPFRIGHKDPEGHSVEWANRAQAIRSPDAGRQEP